MILELIMTPIFALVKFILNLIPSFNPKGHVLTSIQVILDIWVKVSYFIPVNLILICIGLLFVIDNWNRVVFVSNWLIKKIR